MLLARNRPAPGPVSRTLLFSMGALVVVLASMVALLAWRELSREPPPRDERKAEEDDDDRREEKAPKDHPRTTDPPSNEPRVKALKSTSFTEIRSAIVSGGYRITFEDGSSAFNRTHSWLVQKLPCVGNAMLMDLDDRATVERVAKTNLATGAGVLVDGNTIVMVNVNTASRAPDPACTREVTKLLEK